LLKPADWKQPSIEIHWRVTDINLALAAISSSANPSPSPSFRSRTGAPSIADTTRVTVAGPSQNPSGTRTTAASKSPG
jgi:hypothetical protein